MNMKDKRNIFKEKFTKEEGEIDEFEDENSKFVIK